MKVLRAIWRWVKWPLIVLVVAYIVFIIYSWPAGRDRYLTQLAVDHIHSQKITLSTVMGDALPSQPYEPENDATLAGLDKNNNGIRDDVELAIFAKYPNSAKIRAAELQYALDQEILITEVNNSGTWVAQAQEDGRGFGCIGDTVSDSNADLAGKLRLIQARAKEIEDLVFNTQMRKTADSEAEKFATSFSELGGVNDCDVDLNSLPN